MKCVSRTIPPTRLYPWPRAGAREIGGDSYGLQLNVKEWGVQAYAFRHYIFSREDAVRIERAQPQDVIALATKLVDEVDDVWDQLIYFDDPLHSDLQFNPGFIALRAAIWGFASTHHDDLGTVRAFGRELQEFSEECASAWDDDMDPLDEIVQKAFVVEAAVHPEVMSLLDALAYAGYGSAAIAAVDALELTSRRGQSAGHDPLSITTMLRGEIHRDIQSITANVHDMIVTDGAEQRAFNESSQRDTVVNMMIEDPQAFVEGGYGYLSLASTDYEGFEKILKRIAECDHPRLNEAMDSLFDLAQQDDLAFAMICQMATNNDHAWDLLDSMKVGDLLSRWERHPELVRLLYDQWRVLEAFVEVFGDEPGSIAEAFAKLDTLALPENHETLIDWAVVGSRRAQEILDGHMREAQSPKRDDDDTEGGVVISLLDALNKRISE